MQRHLQNFGNHVSSEGKTQAPDGVVVEPVVSTLQLSSSNFVLRGNENLPATYCNCFGGHTADPELSAMFIKQHVPGGQCCHSSWQQDWWRADSVDGWAQGEGRKERRKVQRLALPDGWRRGEGERCVNWQQMESARWGLRKVCMLSDGEYNGV